MYAPRTEKRALVQPINMIFRLLQSRTNVHVWLVDNVGLKIAGHITGFDEYMNIVMDNAKEIQKHKEPRHIGRILLKGENITLIEPIK